MKTSLLAATVALGLGLVALNDAYAITEAQSYVVGVLESLKMTLVKSKVIGGPQKFKVTKGTLELLKNAADEGKVVVVDSEGKVTIERE
jgi:hypothetical protein